MGADSFRDVRSLIALPGSTVFRARLFGALYGLFHVGWIILFVLFVDLLLSEGKHATDTHETLEHIERLTGVKVRPGQTINDVGMLPTVLHMHRPWIRPIFEKLYVSQPWTQHNMSYLIGLLVGGLILGVIRVVLMYAHSLAVIQAVAAGVNHLQGALFLHKFTLGSQAFHPETGSRLSGLLRVDVPEVAEAIRASLISSPRDFVRILALLALAFALNPWLGLTFLLLATLVWIVGSMLLQRAIRRRRELSERADAQLERLRGLADKLRLIKGYAADKYFQDHYAAHLEQHRQDNVHRMRYEARVAPVWNFLGLLVVLALAGLAAQNVLTDKFGIAGAAGVFTCLLSIAWSLNQWFNYRKAVIEATPAAGRIRAFLDETAIQSQVDGTLFLGSLHEGIVFDDVSYRDSVGRMVLNDLTCRIPAGRRTALLATDPVEAQALVDLLNRFIEPTRGVVKFDGQDLRASTLESLRVQVCLVLQSDLLFPDTVANNIGCGDPGFDRERIIEAAKVAHAHNFIEKLPHGYDCIVGEQGFPLKAGEKYRIALARAILRDPHVVVLEEPAVPLDADSESLLDDTMTRFLNGRTAVLLPKRLASLQSCDYIMILDKGRIAAQGTHGELFTTNALYRFLHLTRFDGVAAHQPQHA
jgi:ATP-binding cassette subfamily B protein